MSEFTRALIAQGQAVGAPTEPAGVDEAYDEGSGYPEEDEDQSF